MLVDLTYDLILLERDLSNREGRCRPVVLACLSLEPPGRAVFAVQRGEVTLNLGLLSPAVHALNTVDERNEVWALPSSRVSLGWSPGSVVPELCVHMRVFPLPEPVPRQYSR